MYKQLSLEFHFFICIYTNANIKHVEIPEYSLGRLQLDQEGPTAFD